jgi:hypothetical protein
MVTRDADHKTHYSLTNGATVPERTARSIERGWVVPQRDGCRWPPRRPEPIGCVA